MWSPTIEVSERDAKLEILVELPGLRENEVKVEVTDEGLVIRGERKREHEGAAKAMCAPSAVTGSSIV